MKTKVLLATLALTVVLLSSFTVSKQANQSMKENLASFKVNESNEDPFSKKGNQFKSSHTTITVFLFAIAFNLGPRPHLSLESKDPLALNQLRDLDSK